MILLFKNQKNFFLPNKNHKKEFHIHIPMYIWINISSTISNKREVCWHPLTIWHFKWNYSSSTALYFWGCVLLLLGIFCCILYSLTWEKFYSKINSQRVKRQIKRIIFNGGHGQWLIITLEAKKISLFH